jgi:hypothetical protein
MNSSQRRRIRRHFIFTVTVPASHAEQYFQHDEKIEDARTWCRKQFKKDNWYSNQHWDQSEFKFVKESDAVLFSLKWV